MQSCRVLSRALSTTVRRQATKRVTFEKPGAVGEVPNTPGYKKIMDLQKLMCADDGLLVWQKRGVRDAFPYYASVALMCAGVSYAFYQIFLLSVPKKQ